MKFILILFFLIGLSNFESCQTKPASKAEVDSSFFFEDSDYSVIDSFEHDSSVFGNYKVTADTFSKNLEEYVSSIKLYKGKNLINSSLKTLEGRLVGIELTKFSNKKNLVLIMYSRCTGSGGFDFSTFYYLQNNQWKEFTFQENQDTNAFIGYFGHDEYYVEKGKLYRQFQKYNDSDANCCPTTGLIRIIKYKLTNHQFEIENYYDIDDPDWEEMKQQYSETYE